jgi:hypothetical protein
MVSEAFWIFLVLAMWGIGFLLLRHYRRKTAGYANHQVFKAALPSWVRQLEFYCLAIALAAYVLLGIAGVDYLYQGLHPHNRIAGLAAVLTILAVFIPALVLAMLTSNLVSWMIPPARTANLKAMSSVGSISFTSLNRGLLTFGLILAPICVIQALVGLFEPWTR